ncbi:MAG: DASS family sodium-coupled anion symporter [Alistipes sp.]|nr:DASS family sodium-coupled anion symporter [Alistipes sp.]
MEQENKKQAAFDPLDMNNYKIEKLPKMEKSTFEKWMARVGGPLAIVAFILVYWVVDIPFIDNLKQTDFIPAEEVVVAEPTDAQDAEVVDVTATQQSADQSAETESEPLTEAETTTEQSLATAETEQIVASEEAALQTEAAQIEELPTTPEPIKAEATAEKAAAKPDESLKKAVKFIEENGWSDFTRANYAMLAIFIAAIILWITEPIPNYLTALLVILGIVLTEVTTQKVAFATLGHPVMWLNILSFVLASMLVKTRVAKRLALWFVLKFGHSASGVFFSFVIINVILSAFISATTVKAAILLPIFMVVAAVYGASQGNRNNFGRNIVLQNLFQVNIGASGFLTGSGANLLAASLIGGAIGLDSIGYMDWFNAAFPLAIILLIIGWFVGTKIIFPIPKEQRKPQIEGGLVRLREELDSMGKMTTEEYKAVAIFVGVLGMWATTDILHSIDATTVAFIGAVIALLPGVGVVKWNDVDIPWHLMLFSAGAYAIGAGLDATALPKTMVDVLFNSLGVSEATPFWVLYLVLTGMMLFSALLFQSKTMRALIFVPIAIGVAQKYGYEVMSLAFPVALLIEHVYVLPFNSKPAALLYTTNHYSWSDTFKYGFTMMLIGWGMIILWGETVLRWLGHTPNGLF